MEKEKIRSAKLIEKTTCEVTLDEDYVIRDYKPDIRGVILPRGEVCIEETKTVGNTLWISGHMRFSVLYRTECEDVKIDCVEGEIPFQEKMMLDSATENMIVSVEPQIWDLNASIINSRKLAIRAIVSMQICCEEIVEEEILCASQTERVYEEKVKTEEFYSLKEKKSDVLRLEAQTTLPPSKPNIRKILWYGIEEDRLKQYPKDSEILVEGELCVTILYQSEEEEQLQWSEHRIPIEGTVKTNNTKNPELFWIKASCVQCELAVENDGDGEPRKLAFHISLAVKYEYWECKKMQMLVDAYALNGDLKIQKSPCNIPVFLMKNIVQGRVCERFHLDLGQEKILQNCYCRSNIQLDEIEIKKDALEFKGVLDVHILYMSADDRNPVAVVNKTIPFTQSAKVRDVTKESDYRYYVKAEELQVNLLDSSELEVKAQLVCGVLAFTQYRGDKIVDMELLPELPKDCRKQANIVGYMVQEKEQLWDIAKNYRTTERELMETNGLKDNEVKRGDKILIIKKRTKSPL